MHEFKTRLNYRLTLSFRSTKAYIAPSVPHKPSMAKYSCNPTTQEVKAQELEFKPNETALNKYHKKKAAVVVDYVI